MIESPLLSMAIVHAYRDSTEVYLLKDRLLPLIERARRDRKWKEFEVRVCLN